MYDSTIFHHAVRHPGCGLGSTALDEEKRLEFPRKGVDLLIAKASGEVVIC